MTLDVAAIKADFPMLAKQIDGKRLVYLDSAATSQKPNSVIEAMDDYYRNTYASVNRGAYRIAAEATDLFESARADIARFINAPETHEVIFTKNATEAFNLFVQSWGGANLGPGDAVVISEMEHHANIVPWHILRERLGFELRWIPLTPDGQLDLTDLDTVLDGAKVASVTAMSNVLGTLNPIRQLADAVHAAGAIMVADGSQFVPHLPTDVAELGVDALVFTGHKMCAVSYTHLTLPTKA